MIVDDVLTAIIIFLPNYISFLLVSLFLYKKYKLWQHSKMKKAFQANFISAFFLFCCYTFCLHQLSRYSGKNIDDADPYQKFLLWDKWSTYVLVSTLFLGATLLFTAIFFIIKKRRRGRKIEKIEKIGTVTY